ncbi:MAG: hypothetical protein JEY94_19035 [Melioribacteraceae bacterium]|nr:hypothetical protein [Melioribacteraceae bacterium]
MLKKYCFIIILLIFVTSPVKGQNWNWDNDFEFWNWYEDRPTIEINYGLGKPDHKNIKTDFSEFGMVEVKLGYSSIDEYYDHIVNLEESFLFAGNYSQDISSDDKLGIEADVWRFGFMRKDGIGYSVGEISLIPYSQFGIAWSRLKSKNFYNADLDENIAKTFDRYGDTFRFTTLAEAGIKLEVSNFAGINVGYEGTIIYPRYLVWKHLGSLAINAAATSALDNFVNEILDSSPYAAPIVNFLLKNGLSLAFFQLQKDKMNWPFKTEKPLSIETFKVGVEFNF